MPKNSIPENPKKYGTHKRNLKKKGQKENIIFFLEFLISLKNYNKERCLLIISHICKKKTKI